MQAQTGRQAKRVARRGGGHRQPAATAEMRYAGGTIGADERRHAQAVVVAFGLAFVAICMAYLVLAAGDILG